MGANIQNQNRAVVWLGTALLFSFLLSLIITAALARSGTTFRDAWAMTAQRKIVYLLQPTGDDSWTPMLKAYRQKIEDPGSDLYKVFFVDHVKFQYPPSSLMVFNLFPPSMTELVDGAISERFRQWLSWLSRAAVLLTVLTSAVILKISLDRRTEGLTASPARAAIVIILFLLLALTSYPLIMGYRLGQIQVFLNSLIALALLFRLLGWKTLAGACVGACCLIKPQYGAVLLWSLLRREWRFTMGLAGVLLAGLTVSIAQFGLQDHLRYLDVLQVISRQGEAYLPNQSVNGLVNRLLGNGDPAHFSPTDFAPFNPTVYFITMISTVAILSLALWHRRSGQYKDSGPIDLAVMLAASTIASPVAWQHHYGAFVPIFAIALPGLIYSRPLGWATAPLLALSYAAMANFVQWERVLRNPWLGVVGSHLFFGSIIFFILLLALRAGWWNDQASRVCRR